MSISAFESPKLALDIPQELLPSQSASWDNYYSLLILRFVKFKNNRKYLKVNIQEVILFNCIITSLVVYFFIVLFMWNIHQESECRYGLQTRWLYGRPYWQYCSMDYCWLMLMLKTNVGRIFPFLCMLFCLFLLFLLWNFVKILRLHDLLKFWPFYCDASFYIWSARDERPEDWVPEETSCLKQKSHEQVECSEITNFIEDNGDAVDIFSIHSENPTGSCSTLMSWNFLALHSIFILRKQLA